MKNKILILILFIILISGCTSKKISIPNKYRNNNGLTKINNTKLNKLENKKDTFILFVYNPFCTFKIPCDEIFEKYSKDNNIEILKIPFNEYKKNKYYKKVKYSPTIIIVNNGKIIAYLDAENDKDIDKYQNIKEFTKWINKYIK